MHGTLARSNIQPPYSQVGDDLKVLRNETQNTPEIVTAVGLRLNKYTTKSSFHFAISAFVQASLRQAKLR
jgi:hypothetical protein